MYCINFCREDRPIFTMAGFFVSQAKRRGWTTSSVEAKTGRGGREREEEGGRGRERETERERERKRERERERR